VSEKEEKERGVGRGGGEEERRRSGEEEHEKWLQCCMCCSQSVAYLMGQKGKSLNTRKSLNSDMPRIFNLENSFNP